MEIARLNDLVTILNEEVDLLARLHSTLLAQQQALVDGDVEQVTATVEEQIEILRAIGAIEEKRTAILASENHEGDVTKLKLDHLIDAAPDYLASELSRTKQALKNVLDAIGRVNTQNGMLINQSLAYIDNTIKLVAGEDRTSAVYTPQGDVKRTTGHIVINRTI